jgi:catechol 2,3-dioxygenase-like lactoylglutathione lyase family enzyme
MAGCAVIAPDPQASRSLFIGALGLPLEAAEGSEYAHSEHIAGVKHFGVWPLSEAAQSCFGTPQWPADRPVPQASFEFDVADAEGVEEAAKELVAAGHALIHDARLEPWGQTVARLQAPEGSIVGISYTPSMHS